MYASRQTHWCSWLTLPLAGLALEGDDRLAGGGAVQRAEEAHRVAARAVRGVGALELPTGHGKPLVKRF